MGWTDWAQPADQQEGEELGSGLDACEAAEAEDERWRGQQAEVTDQLAASSRMSDRRPALAG